MRRFILAVFTLALLAGFHTAQAAPAVSYPAGWNLVAGPAGTTFPGASAVWGYPPYASAYQAASATATGMGYWAYYAQGGAPNLAGNASNCRVTLAGPAGQWFLAGNPSGTTTATVIGASSVLAFIPATNNYIAAPSLAPGQGAWVMPDSGGVVTIDGGDCGLAPVAGAPLPVATASIQAASPSQATGAASCSAQDAGKAYDVLNPLFQSFYSQAQIANYTPRFSLTAALIPLETMYAQAQAVTVPACAQQSLQLILQYMFAELGTLKDFQLNTHVGPSQVAFFIDADQKQAVAQADLAILKARAGL